MPDSILDIMSTIDISGIWQSKYTYRQGTHSSRHTVSFTQQPDGVWIGTGEGTDGSSITLRLVGDASRPVVTGLWHETTSATGKYEGKVFHGALQLILNNASTEANGKWVGFNSGVNTIDEGRWTLIKQ
jgi:hypothetical protein